MGIFFFFERYFSRGTEKRSAAKRALRAAS
jgi:hypothetical protein